MRRKTKEKSQITNQLLWLYPLIMHSIELFDNLQQFSIAWATGYFLEAALRAASKKDSVLSKRKAV